MLSNPDVNLKNGVAYKKNRISNFKHPGDLNEILIKGNISIKTEQKEAEMLISVVSNPVKVAETIDTLISNNETYKIPVEGNIFRLLKMENWR